MITTTKDAFLSSSKNKSPQREKITDKYLSLILSLNSVFSNENKQIQNKYDEYEKQLGVQSAISKKNTQSALLQKGLSKSGESVQSSILGDMAYMGNLATLMKNEGAELSKLNAQKQSAISNVYSDMIAEQIEADRQKEHDESEYNKWLKEFEHQAEREKILDQRDQRDYERKVYESDRDYNLNLQKFNHEAEIDKTSQDISKNELYIKNQYLNLEKEKSSSSQSKNDSENLGYIITEAGYYLPTMTPDEFIDSMTKGSGDGKGTSFDFITPKTLGSRLKKIMEDESIDPQYRQILEVHARARGLLD